MQHDVNDLIQRYIRSQTYDKDTSGRGGPGAMPLVAMARDYGAGGEEIAMILARELKVSYFDEVLLERLAKHTEQDQELLRELDEKVSAWKSTWVYSVLSGDAYFMSTYRKALVNVLLAISAEGGVIMGRGGHVFLRDRAAFRVRICGSPRHCARRVAEKEGLSEDEAREKVETINQQRQQFLWSLIQRRTNDPTQFDLTINTDKLHDWDKVATMILSAMKDVGLSRPAHAPRGSSRP
ncbi:AAA family ATPase [Ectothiorhodospira lacustris]|uniref:cytidylate kinase-like family protein n=1 Tax=Ectothiorhodospira lacustris TaxID=2899127 RepID=UPI001EE88373|nr:cytidylate kinase-like family protein [Ectothiorhodospira lacustris]MCG5499352.1 cytidylate kinase-like family protein [Ectothiorhodospira lacustris]MCG5509241.1 cytidylate kinase-like family protein [Ectothiorhodospira lacustris]MCG5521031.1 cytidylate kinase-like family protein [Ectothiorhodospira lacustris]